MSYSVFHNGLPFYEPLSQYLTLKEPTLQLEANRSGSLTFRMPMDHEAYSSIQQLGSIFDVYDAGSLIWRGRCISADVDVMGEKTVAAEGQLGWLQDSCCDPFDFSGSVAEFVAAILSWHNSKVQTFQRINMGDCTILDNYVHYTSIEYMSAWDILKTRLLDTHGGYMRIRYNQRGYAYLDYLADFPNAAVHEVRPHQNLVDLLTRDDAQDLYTAVVPLGAKLTDENGVQTGERLTIASVNSGSVALVNTALAAQLGIRYAPVSLTTWDDVTLASNLLSRGQAWLAQQGSTVKSSVTLGVAQLSGVDAARMRLYDKVHFRSLMHDIDVTMLISTITLKLDSAKASRVSLGSTFSTMLDSTVSSAASISAQLKLIESTYMTTADAISLIGRVCSINTSGITTPAQLAALLGDQNNE